MEDCLVIVAISKHKIEERASMIRGHEVAVTFHVMMYLARLNSTVSIGEDSYFMICLCHQVQDGYNR
ncbi:hypothetical protein FRX31_005200 [Thalictrum thalictroides]|uniref:Uncharacterized protein n=1 Tax=Thalictrum thalictroides TaxID=46969 RepID=A0A7J6X736_THATH|nr:hypothetical protein FRX31_005200 [Thalictrum thalictroides]